MIAPPLPVSVPALTLRQCVRGPGDHHERDDRLQKKSQQLKIT